MTKSYIISFLHAIGYLFCLNLPILAQTNNAQLETEILQRDSMFWEAYNTCDTSNYRQFFTRDVEFYHDKGGITTGVDNIISSFKENLCGENFRLRRKAVAGSLHVFPLENANGLYGAIMTGEHVFYVLERGKTERLDGQAKFSHLWILQNNTWKMSRIISYDHGPVPYINTRREIKLPVSTLDYFTGKYKGPHSGTLTVERDKDNLVLINNNRRFLIYPESANVFFSKDRNLSFEFLRNEHNLLSKLVIRENGQVAEVLNYTR